VFKQLLFLRLVEFTLYYRSLQRSGRLPLQIFFACGFYTTWLYLFVFIGFFKHFGSLSDALFKTVVVLCLILFLSLSGSKKGRQLLFPPALCTTLPGFTTLAPELIFIKSYLNFRTLFIFTLFTLLAQHYRLFSLEPHSVCWVLPFSCCLVYYFQAVNPFKFCSGLLLFGACLFLLYNNRAQSAWLTFGLINTMYVVIRIVMRRKEYARSLCCL